MPKRKKPRGPKPLGEKTDLGFEAAAALVVGKPKPEKGWPSLEEPEAEAEEDRPHGKVAMGDGTDIE